MIRLENVSVVFQGRPLFEGANWQITERSRVGLVGLNGSGKSTILKVIAGVQEVESGRVVRAKNFSIGYLPQELHGSSDKPVFDEALSGCGSAQSLERQISEVTSAMQEADPSSEEYSELLMEYGRLHHLYEEADGFSAESKTGRVLLGLGVPQEWWQWPMNRLSGGWQMRVHLARLILSAPSLLLLDEPTNHLDVESILWLSTFLRNYEGGLILISHDRYFLDENTREIVEMWNGALHFYAGNYSFYRKEKELRLELLRNAYNNQQEEISRIQQFIDRFRYKATKARQVQSRILMLEKMEKIQLPQESAQIRLRVPVAPRSGRVVLEAKHLGHHYSGKPVFSGLDFQIERGEKIALVGVNGAGKTTLLKILAGHLKPAEGENHIGYNVYPAYYAQMVTEQLDLRNNVLDEVSSSATNHDETQLRSVLGSFLFSGEDVYKKISVLSGGEKSRVSLAKILLKPSNLLLLDEPTNHLDMQSKEILLQALQEFEGAILFISHDRYFMDQLAQKVLELKNGKLTSYFGNYSEYLGKLEADSSPVATNELLVTSNKPEEPKTFHKSKEQKKQEALLRQQQSKKKKDVIEPLHVLEKEIETGETRLKELERILSDDKTYEQKDSYFQLISEYEKLKKSLESSYAKWETLQQKETS
jgi:ATP-binding cassette subfamily F protein 3